MLTNSPNVGRACAVGTGSAAYLHSKWLSFTQHERFYNYNSSKTHIFQLIFGISRYVSNQINNLPLLKRDDTT